MLETFLNNIINLNVELGGFITAFCYILGILMFAKGLFRLRKMSDYRTMAYQPVDFVPVAVQLLIATAFIYAPNFLDIAAETIFNTSKPSILAYTVDDSTTELWITALRTTLQVVGLISFFRGFYMLSKMGEGQAQQQGGSGKAFAHIVGGLLCYHMGAFAKILESTFGISFNIF